MHYMLNEIREQPGWVDQTLEAERNSVSELVNAMRDRNIRFVVIAARGTSDNAAVYLKYLFEIMAGIPVALAAPSVYTLYDAHLHLDNVLVMGISQSGEGSDVVQALSSARSAGALTACITNSSSSPITHVCDHVLLSHAGDERAVAATKTYTTALATAALLVARLVDSREILAGLHTISARMRETLETEEQIFQAVERFRYMEECAVLARGINQATALEAALKMVETSYVAARPFSGADFLHGPVAMLHDGFPCFLFAPEGRAYPFMLELALKIQARGGEMVIFSRELEILDLATVPLKVPVSIPEILSPLIYAIPAQLFACHLSTLRGSNPDAPRGLTKVTKTL